MGGRTPLEELSVSVEEALLGSAGDSLPCHGGDMPDDIAVSVRRRERPDTVASPDGCRDDRFQDFRLTDQYVPRNPPRAAGTMFQASWT